MPAAGRRRLRHTAIGRHGALPAHQPTRTGRPGTWSTSELAFRVCPEPAEVGFAYLDVAVRQRRESLDRSGSGEIAATMIEAAKRLAETMAEKAAPRVSDAHHRVPHGIRYGLDRTTRSDEQSAAELYRLGSAGHADRGTGRDRFEISEEEARNLYRQVRDLLPDAAGNMNRVNTVHTSAGRAVVRRGLDQPVVTMVKKWMPENAAIAYARSCGVRTPRILYSGTDPSTGRRFTIMQYVPGETRAFNDPEMMNWLPDLLDQVQLISSRPLPAGMNLDTPAWQQQMIRHADDDYRSLPPERRSRLDRLGIGPLSDYVRPDVSRSAEPTVFAHNDLFPSNLRLDNQGKLWILDWEVAGPGDPLYNAQFFLQRMGSEVDDATRAQATDMWLDRITPANSAVDTGAILSTYRSMEDWRGMVICSERMPREVSADPDRFDFWVDWYDSVLSRNPEFWPDIPKSEVRAILRGWVPDNET
ncbi:aminoglycoside phosphotransferase family protein [Nocardia sp. NPDC050799]|uniref:aminoglycoside phosphotransferase family protein n=1 Tax=Nocardia sp. NPDC050799 TaxID=3154842 RepID=UPI0034088567